MDFEVISQLFMRGDVPAAIEYMSQFDELKDMVAAYRELFEREHYLVYDIPKCMNEVLLEYQRYFRDVFYLGMEEKEASDQLMARLELVLKEVNTGVTQSDAEADLESRLSDAMTALFEQNGYHILTGRTQGYYGPYVWKTTEPITYEVELPDGSTNYVVNILRDFVMCGWMRYLTFGRFGTNGWASPDGTINCLENGYDFDSESFRISLLKHEAQHLEDFKNWPSITPIELEYRAKLVELIYTTTPELLNRFIRQGCKDNPDDSHAMAAARIVEGIGDLADKDVAEIQKRARELFIASTKEMNAKYM